MSAVQVDPSELAAVDRDARAWRLLVQGVADALQPFELPPLPPEPEPPSPGWSVRVPAAPYDWAMVEPWPGYFGSDEFWAGVE